MNNYKITIMSDDEEYSGIVNTTVGHGKTYAEAEANADKYSFPELTQGEIYFYAGLVVLLLVLVTILIFRLFEGKEKQNAAIEKILTPEPTLTIDNELMEKLKVCAKLEDRTTNKQAERIIREYIQNYESKHGEIVLDK